MLSYSSNKCVICFKGIFCRKVINKIYYSWKALLGKISVMHLFLSELYVFISFIWGSQQTGFFFLTEPKITFLVINVSKYALLSQHLYYLLVFLSRKIDNKINNSKFTVWFHITSSKNAFFTVMFSFYHSVLSFSVWIAGPHSYKLPC